MSRLNEHLTHPLAPSGPAGHLDELLKKALGPSKISTEQVLIGIQHADQCDALEIMPFREHLSANEDIDVTLPNRVQGILKLL